MLSRFIVGGNNTPLSIYDSPKRLCAPGEIYVCTKPFLTLANKVYTPGDLFVVVERTWESPYGWYSSLGNLKIKCKYMTSVWGGFEAMIIDGYFVAWHKNSIKNLLIKRVDELKNMLELIGE